jgi:hypothetical protein
MSKINGFQYIWIQKKNRCIHPNGGTPSEASQNSQFQKNTVL